METPIDENNFQNGLCVSPSPILSEFVNKHCDPFSRQLDFSDRKPLIATSEEAVYILNNVVTTPIFSATEHQHENIHQQLESSPDTVEEIVDNENLTSNDEEESLRLAMQLMEQDNLEAYNIQMQFIQQNSNEMNSDDLAMIQLIMREQGGHYANNVSGGEEGDEQDDEEDSEQWDYERLLALGEQIGDVKTERWRSRAPSIIAQLKRIEFSVHQELIAKATPGNCSGQCISDESSMTCTICLDGYAPSSIVHELRCGHFFHESCCAQWLQNHNCCPLCKVKITNSP